MAALNPPNSHQKASIDQRLSQDPKKTEEDVTAMINWISKHPELNIPNEFKNKTFLERFLFGCKFDLPTACKKFENYCKIRKTFPDFFQKRDPTGQGLTQSYETVYMFTLPDLTDEGHRVSFCGLLNPDVNKFSAKDMAVRSLMHFDVRLQEECCLGDIYVMDLKLFSISHIFQYSYAFIKKSVECQLDAMPFRVKGIHFLNSPTFIGKFINLLKILLKEKLRKRIHVHYSDSRTLHEYIPKKILPKEFEGEGLSIKQYNDAWRDKLISYRDWFLQQDEFFSANEDK